MSTTLPQDFHQANCPVCNVSWDGGSIVDTFIQQRNEGDSRWEGKTDEDIRKYVMGWSDDDILQFIDQNMSFGSENEMLDFMNQDRKIISDYLYNNFRVSIDATYSSPYRWSRIIGIEVPHQYDGVSYWRCPDCGTQWSRWSREEIPHA